MQSDRRALCQLPTPWNTPGSEVLSILQLETGCAGIQLEVIPVDVYKDRVASWRIMYGETAKSKNPKRSQQCSLLRYVHRDRLSSWVFTVNTGQKGFSKIHDELLDLILLRWHNDFMSGPTVEGGHVLLDAHQRLITADLKTQSWLVGQPNALDELFAKVAEISRQRFESVSPYQPVELILDYAGQHAWITLTASSAGGDTTEGYYGEIRLVPNGEVPVYGLIEDPRVARVLGFLDTRYNENPDLKALAKGVGLSIYHLHRLFSEYINISPKQYLLCRQLQVAKWLLRTTSLQISEVAERSGFNSSGHFSTTFNRVTSIKPIQYRNRFE
ncbi:MAG: AraC family transcriptional regulator [Planctomycetota bacterium]